ncbi:MAG: SulP family inorganic anion transporter [Candidatus Nanopelagicales bacterium]
MSAPPQGPTRPSIGSLRAKYTPRVIRTETLAGLVVALALIPEAISFSIIAGVDPKVGLYASFTMAVTIAFLGGRPALISAATGAIALVVAPLAREYGVQYLFAAVILGGIFQVILAAGGIAKLMRFIPRSVMIGFVNALAILIALAQLPSLIDVPWLVYPMVLVGIAMIVVLPRLTTAVPAPLVAILGLTGVTLLASLNVPNVGDEGTLPDSFPQFLLPDVPFTTETLGIIAPYALAVALVGLMESLMTAKLVDDITDTHSNKTRESWGQGCANVVTGFFGGMGGCAMIGQTMINVKSAGARTRLSTFLAGLFLLILVVVFGDVVSRIPMAALVAVMLMVAAATFDWHSVKLSTLRRLPKTERFVMVVTVAVVVVTSNLAIGVIVGVVVAMVMFARRVAHMVDVSVVMDPDDQTRIYKVTGELFFAISNDLVFQFNYATDPHDVVIDMSDAHIWDPSAVAALDSIQTKYESKGKTAIIVGMNRASQALHSRHAGSVSNE